MGAFHMSQVVFGVDPATVRDRLVRWLRAKGFELQPGEPLVHLHPEHERGLILKTRGDRTIVLYSTLTEQPRLLYELQRVGGAVLDSWMHDSDLWGYQLHEGTRCTAAFNSQPRYFGGEEGSLGPDDLGAVARISGLDEGTLRKARKTRALFAEGLNEGFLAAMGARGAATQYAYHAEDAFRPAFDEGFEVEHLWFRREGYDPLAKLDLTELDFTPQAPEPAELSPEQQEAMAAAQARAQRQARLFQLVFLPLGLLFRLLFAPWIWLRTWRLKRQLQAAQATAEDSGSLTTTAPPSPVEQSPDGALYHPDLGLRAQLPAGAVRRDHDLMDLGRGRAFSCHLREHALSIRAASVMEVQNLARFVPPGTSIVQELDFAGARPLKIVKQTNEGSTPFWSCLALVKGPQALFLGEARGTGPMPEEVAEALVDFVRSVRFEGEEEAG